ncbi:hypothetical protein RIF29_12621 [Crotalaria pallida]|uniref:Phytosulfokine n=1 Tax=Crotalaria pallida TaxID=3830 RepID=A0AAN9INH0_CROPI
MSKLAIIFTLSLLICFTLIYASRPISSLHGIVTKAKAELDDDDESCKGVEECLMRRTLAAHVDYIYTDKQKPRN